jgi:hypothetical protein
VQCRVELVARLVQACGPPAAPNTGRTIIRLLLQIADGMARLRCGPVPLWHLFMHVADLHLADRMSQATAASKNRLCTAAACAWYCGLLRMQPH